MTLFYTQAAVQGESKTITDLKATIHKGTDRIEAAARHEAKEIKDQLGEMNKSIDTLASSMTANQSFRGKFIFFYKGDVVVLPFCLRKEICNCFSFRQNLIIPGS